jgi:hypothetical protein
LKSPLHSNRVIGGYLIDAEFQKSKQVSPFHVAKPARRVGGSKGPGINLGPLVVADPHEIDPVFLCGKNELPG